MKMTLDELQDGEGLIPGVFVDMKVAIATNRQNLFFEAMNATTGSNVIGFVGMYVLNGDQRYWRYLDIPVDIFELRNALSKFNVSLR
jgi:hypothetical protein